MWGIEIGNSKDTQIIVFRTFFGILLLLLQNDIGIKCFVEIPFSF